ncbi:hypothetical protein J4E93_006488 [Alternaria ventricosa]|uniref:uncharacterized protein n=1 Tax=Alternaria ventricosa TaxID=1187951 RepID=UPI0020C4337C|nr:uncharacterized protein J4E93_006488 [Alternaria ventricosa]KAI4643478.1 hypothetical protein J4E93_006488 [Alternaria ventricosa]
MTFTFNPEVDYAPAPSPPTSAAHMGPSWNAVWRIAISNPDKVAALAEAKGMIKEKLRWERAVAAEKRERMRLGVSAWKLDRELDEWKPVFGQ